MESKKKTPKKSRRPQCSEVGDVNTRANNVESSVRTAGLCAVARIATAYRAPMNANGAAERMNL